MGTFTRIEVVARPGGRPTCRTVTGHLSPQRLTTTDGTVRFALVAATALLLAGDEVHLEVVVDGPVHLDLIETAGTVAYDMRGAQASWDVTVSLRGAASLAWAGEPFVVSDGAEVSRSMRIDLDVGCRAALRESIVLGRSDEAGGRLRTVTTVEHGTTPLLREDLDLGPDVRAGWAVLGPHRCMETVSTYGYRLPRTIGGDSIHLDLEGPASMVRRLGSHAHATRLVSSWAEAIAALQESPPVSAGRLRT